MKNNKTIVGLVAGLLLSVTSVTSIQAEENAISANVSIANDYVWRGKTQTTNNNAISGGFDYDSGVGFTAGVWGANVTGGSEFDYYASYGNELGGGVGYEVGYIAYRYAHDSTLDFEEIYIGGSYADFGLTYYLGQDTAADYLEASYGKTFDVIDMSLTFGDYDQTASDNNGYTVYGISFGNSYAGLDFGLSFSKTSEDNAANTNESNTVFSISKSF